MQECFGYMVVGIMEVDGRLALNPPATRTVVDTDRLVLIRKQEVVDTDAY